MRHPAAFFASTRRLGAALLIALSASSAFASIISNHRLEIDFTRADEASVKAAWSETVSPGPGGLGWDAEPAALRSAWMQTKPLAVGLWWRPGPSVGVRVEISPAPTPITLAGGQTYTPWGGRVFARYSADRRHWSNWQALERRQPEPPVTAGAVAAAGLASATPTPTRTLGYTGTLGVPQRERQAYLRHLETYSTLDVPWASDEEALCQWIEAEDPEFFARCIPFVGYVEFLFENDFHGSQRMTSFQANVGFGISGASAIPRDPADKRINDNSPWRFVGKTSETKIPKP